MSDELQISTINFIFGHKSLCFIVFHNWNTYLESSWLMAKMEVVGSSSDELSDNGSLIHLSKSNLWKIRVQHNQLCIYWIFIPSSATFSTRNYKRNYINMVQWSPTSLPTTITLLSPYVDKTFSSLFSLTVKKLMQSNSQHTSIHQCNLFQVYNIVWAWWT